MGVLLLATGLMLLATIAMVARAEAETDAVPTWLQPGKFPESQRKLIEFLLLLPIAVTLVAFVRVVIGLTTFGTFAPALLGLAYREVESPVGIFILLIVLFAGWFARHAVNHLHLLQVPRTSLMLTLVVSMLVGLILLGEKLRVETFQALPLFPLVILTGMIERFWTVDEEQGTLSTLSTLMVTLILAGGIALLLRWPVISRQMLDYPETLGIVMAVQLLLGRYTGYRLTELYRFRSLMEDEPCAGFSERND
jgi:hypothetical protein